ncbi:MAG: TonB family protein [Gemmatimonadota bacterium]
MSKPAGQGRAPAWTQSANHRWKKGWSAAVLRSTIIAAIAHAVLFAAWPVWNIVYNSPPEPTELVQLTPVLSYGSVEAPGTSPLASQTSLEVPDVGADEGGVGLEEEVAALTEIFGDPTPRMASLPIESSVTGRPDSPLESELILDELSAITPRVTRMTANVAWPQIRNPTRILRFLRMRYNPVRMDPGANGHVSVSMWIDERGLVEWAEVRESSGHAVLDEIALSMFSDVVIFAPARSGGAPVPVGVTISVPFTLPW